MEEPKIGVYVCHCGVNIAATVDVKKVIDYAKKLPNVVVAKDYVYMCSDPGQDMIKKDIRELGLNRVVVASCSPRMHEPTFRKAVEEAGLNKYLYEHANLREHCSWVHTREPEKATEKAIDLIKMAVARARLLEPQPLREVEVLDKALVIGAGISGIQAALDLANRGFGVYLVERSPGIGGRLAQLHTLYPTGEEAKTNLKKRMEEVAGNPNVMLLTHSEVAKVDGYIGNYEVKVVKKPRYVDETKCTACGKCVDVCPIEVSNEFNLGLNRRKAIYLQFPDAIPKAYVIDEENCNKCGECVKVCPENAIDLEQQIKEEEFKVGTIIITTGGDIFDAALKREYGFGAYKNVINNLQLERLTDPSGPTSGRLLRPSDGEEPKKIAFILCVGSRDKEIGNPYCSRYCCMSAINEAKTIMEEIPDAEIYIFHKDIRSFGKGCEELYREVRGLGGVNFIRGEVYEVVENQGGMSLTVKAFDNILGLPVEAEVDMVVLSVGFVASKGAGDLAKILNVSRGPNGFFLEAHPKLRPLDTTTDGIYIGGVAQGPKDVTDSVAQGSGVASRAAVPMAKGKVEIEAILAEVNEDLCSGCRICEAVCVYGAIKMEEMEEGKLLSKITEAVCKGCGACGAACPSGAIKMRHFTDEQILAQVAALFDGGDVIV